MEAFKTGVVKAPEMASVPVGAPAFTLSAVNWHEVLSADDQVTVVDWPLVMGDGVALMVAVGVGGTTTVIIVGCDAGAVPAAPVHDKV